MSSAILASAGWVGDLFFFLFLILGTAYGAYRGFVAGVCKMAGKFASLIFAFVFCISFANFLELCFHMTTGITTGIASSIAKSETYGAGLPQDTLGPELSEALAGMGVGGFQRWLIGLSFKGEGLLIPAGTTPATLIASVIAKWISVAISFVLLVVLVRLGALLINKSFSAISDRVTPIRYADQALGALLGLAKALFFLFVILLICRWLPIDALHNYISSCSIVGKIYDAEWFVNATSYAVSWQWFTDYLQKLV